MRISEIAKKAQVSSMVVSRVIQGSPNVKKADRERVEKAISRLSPDTIAPSISKKNIVKVFGLIVPRFEDIFHSFYATEVIKGAVLAASRLKIDIMVHISERHSHEDWLTSASLSPDYIDGVLFADINGDRQQLKKVLARGIPCVVLNNYFEKEPVNCIAIDNERAAYDVTEYFIRLGHRSIATIAGDLSTEAGKKRLQGFKSCLRSHNVRLTPKYITVGTFLRGPAKKAMEHLLDLSDPPTAVFAASDVMAMEAIDVAKKRGLRVPEDISIIGFDDNPLCSYSPVPLTTVWQPIAEMGREGVEFLNQIINGKKKTPVKVLLKTRLVERKSCIPLV
ncbi:MAG: LacI family DNA-binding transcriptional regulator [Candidatus Omnitrophota bacterium]